MALDRQADQFTRLFNPHPTINLGPLASLQILIMLEEMFDLVDQNIWQILIG